MEHTVVIAITEGLHARPAALFAQRAAGLSTPVTIAKAGGEPVDAASILAVMTLGAEAGDQVTLATPTDDAEAEAALASLVEFLGRETAA